MDDSDSAVMSDADFCKHLAGLPLLALARASQPNATDEDRLAVGWVQQIAYDLDERGLQHYRGHKEGYPIEPPAGFEVAPSPAGCWRFAGIVHEQCEGGPQSSVMWVRWVRPVSA
jgi:hypothetical protein